MNNFEIEFNNTKFIINYTFENNVFTVYSDDVFLNHKRKFPFMYSELSDDKITSIRYSITDDENEELTKIISKELAKIKGGF